VFDHRIRKNENHIAKLIPADMEFPETACQLQMVPSVDLIVAATLRTELPELGHLDSGASKFWVASLPSPGP